MIWDLEHVKPHGQNMHRKNGFIPSRWSHTKHLHGYPLVQCVPTQMLHKTFIHSFILSGIHVSLWTKQLMNDCCIMSRLLEDWLDCFCFILEVLVKSKIFFFSTICVVKSFFSWFYNHSLAHQRPKCVLFVFYKVKCVTCIWMFNLLVQSCCAGSFKWSDFGSSPVSAVAW